MNHNKFYLLMGIVFFFLAAGIRINNNFRFAPACGYDAAGHVSYIYQLKAGWGTPRADEGWSTFHPPLYYFIMANFWKHLGQKLHFPMHMLFRLFSTLMNLGIALLVVMAINMVWPQKYSLSLLGLCFVLFLPLHIYSSSMIGNEQTAAFFISLGIVLLIAYNQRPKPRQRMVLAILMALISGFALLSKYTGIFLVMTITICLTQKIVFEPGRRREHILHLALVFLGCLLISGSFYGRNISLFGTPFPLTQNYPCVAEVMEKQPPGQRRWFDFFGFDLTIFRDPIVRKARGGISPSRSRYVWSLVYSNYWFESFSHFFLLQCDKWRQELGKLLLFLGIFPSFFFVLEIGRESFQAFRRKLNTSTFPLLVLFFLNLSGFIVFNLKTPQFSAGKATYFLASALPLSIFMSRGVQRWMQKGRIYIFIGFVCLMLIFGFSSLAFFLTYT